MKRYIKPVASIQTVALANVMMETSPLSGGITGVDGLKKGEGEFEGGPVDAKSRNDWADGLW